MPGKLLIVNSYHPNARYVPMGSFGICDHLSRRGHEARIWNGALYPPDRQARLLAREIDSFQPQAIGLIMQWKEYTENAIRLAMDLKKQHPGIRIIAGGMTAGYFAEPLLQRHRSIDGVIRGDAEEPLDRILAGRPWDEIPNLVFRDNSAIRTGRGVYRADSRLLNRLSFACLERMADHQRYLEAVEPVLGFPVFIGRGCIHDCQYCGGSRKAFTETSGRTHPVFRSTAAVLEDLRRIGRYTGTIYIGFENSPRYLKKLFRMVAGDPELSGTLTLNYGAWGLPDRELLELYARAFRTGGKRKPILEISPETAVDDHRRLVRDPALFFSNQQLICTLDTVREVFGSSLRVEIYFSRYHHTQDSREALERELAGIHQLHEHLRRRGYGNVVITNYHLATDVGSHNWDRLMERNGGDGLDTLLRGLRKLRIPAPDQPTMDNLCLYTPPSLDRRSWEDHDRLVSWLDLLRKQRADCYFIAARVLGFPGLASCLTTVIKKRRRAGWGQEVTVAGLIHLLRALAREVAETGHGLPADRQALVRDLALLHAGHLAILVGPGSSDGGGLVTRPVVDETKLCVTGWDFSGTDFLRQLEKTDRLPPGEPTLNVYCGRRIVGFARKLECWFRLFDGSRTLTEVLQQTSADNTIDPVEVKKLLVFFTRHHADFTC